jgi:hypothetical protein
VPQLRRVRWAVRATLMVGVAASVAANVLHAQPRLIGQLIAAWPPLALLLTVELISRVPVDRLLLAAARLVATTGIASIAAYVSYFHMASVVSRYGEHNPNPYLLPLSVDGLVVVASISLVELAGRIRAAETNAQRAALPAPAAAPIAMVVPHLQPPASALTVELADHTVGVPPRAPTIAAEMYTEPGAASAADPAPVGQALADRSVDAQAPLHRPSPGDENGDGPPAGTAAAVAYWRAHEPNLSVKQIAEKVGRSTRTVRRVLDRLPDGVPAAPDSADTGRGVNGATVPGLADAVTSR